MEAPTQNLSIRSSLAAKEDVHFFLPRALPWEYSFRGAIIACLPALALPSALSPALSRARAIKQVKLISAGERGRAEWAPQILRQFKLCQRRGERVGRADLLSYVSISACAA